MPMRTHLIAATVMTVAAAMTAAGCGETQIDVKKAAKLIQTAVVQQVGAKVKSVACPKTVKAKAGATFTCLVTGSDGTKGTATVTQKDAKGNITVSAPFLHTREAEASIVSQLKKQAPDAVVHCPEIIIVANGGRFTCKATAAGSSATIQATQSDALGHFTFKVT